MSSVDDLHSAAALGRIERETERDNVVYRTGRCCCVYYCYYSARSLYLSVVSVCVCVVAESYRFEITFKIKSQNVNDDNDDDDVSAGGQF